MTRLLVLVFSALCALPAAAQDTATDCDRLAGYDHTPRRPGLPGVYAVQDAPAAIAACEAALAAPGADPFLNFLLARALLAADPDDPRAVDLVEAGRPASTSFADSRLALMLAEGWGGFSPDPARGLALATASCAAFPDRMAWAGCNNMAKDQIEGDDHGVWAEGLARLEALCTAGMAASCRTLGGAYRDGNAVEPDFARALPYYDLGCQGGDGWACGWSGYMREFGEGTEIDVPGAFPFYVRGCELGDPWSCYAQGENLAEGLGVARDWDAGLALLDRACAMGEDEGCYFLAIKRMHGMDRTSPTTPGGQAAALAYFDASCAAGSARSCTEMGYAHQHGLVVAQDVAAALRFHDRACEGGDGMGCNNMGVHHGQGLGVPVNPEVAAAYYRRACEADVALGCFNLAEVMAPADPVGAAEARSRACTLGHDAACD